MASTLDLHGLCAVLTEQVAKGMRLSSAAVVYYHEGTPEVAGRGDLDEADAEALLALSCESRELVADELEPTSDEHRAMVQRDARLLAGLYAGDSLLGAMVLGSKQSGQSYSPQDIDFLEVLVSEASISMKNALLFDEKRQWFRELTALNELAFALGSSRELDTLLQTALDQVVSVTHADSGSILLLEDGEDYLSIAAAVGIPTEIVGTTNLPGWRRHRRLGR